MSGLDTEAVLALVQDVAEEVVVPRFRALDSEEIDEKGPGDLVTVADQEAERAGEQAPHVRPRPAGR